MRPLPASPLLWLLLPLMAGIAAADACYATLSGWLPWLLAGSLALLASGLLSLLPPVRRSSPRASLAIALTVPASVFLAAASLLVLERRGDELSWPAEAVTSRVMVASSPRERNASVQFEGRQLSGPNAGATVLWTLARQPDASSAPLQPGDVVLCRATVSPLRPSGNPGTFDYATWLRRHGVAGTAFCHAASWQRAAPVPASAMPLSVRALRLRSHLVASYAARFQGRDLAVLSALTLGEKSRLDAATRSLYSQSGVSHVLALSGLHLSILFSAYQLLVLSFCRRRRWLYAGMSVVGLAGIWTFALLAGLPLSLVRAAIMFSVMQGAALWQRDSLSAHNLALAATIILVLSPQALFDVGFQLSCLSVLAILLVVPRVPVPSFVARRPWLRWVYSLLTVSLVAQTATAPLVACHFHALPVYGLLANLVAVPAAWLLLTLSLLFLLLPFAQALLAPLLFLPLRGMDVALTAVAALPGTTLALHPAPLTVLALYGLMGALWQACRAPAFRRRWTAVAVLSLAVCVAAETYARRPGRMSPQIIFYDLPSGAAVHFVASAARSYLWLPLGDAAADDARAAAISRLHQTFWQPRHMSPPTAYADTLSRPDLLARDGVTLFAHRRVAVAGGTLPPPSASPLPVDWLLIAPSCRAPLEAILRRYRPRAVVLSSALAAWRRRAYSRSAAAAHLPVHDIATLGALIVPLEETIRVGE